MPRVAPYGEQGLEHLVGRSVRRHAFLILLVMLACGALGAAAGFQRPVAYTSSASVLLHPLKGNALSPGSTRSGQQLLTAMATEAALANSVPVLERVNEQLGTQVTTGSERVSATVAPNTQIVNVSFRASTAGAARQGAQATAQSLLDYRAHRLETYRTSNLSQLREQEDHVQELLATASKAADRGASAKAVQEVQLFTTQLGELHSRISELQDGASNPGSIIQPAGLPAAPSSLSPWVFVIAGLLLGAALGISVGVARERSDDRVHTEATTVAGLPVVAAAAADQLPPATALTTQTVEEPFRTARATILASAPPPKSISIAASDGFDDAAAVALSLSRSLARAGYGVTIVDTSPDTRLSDLTHLDARVGLTDVLGSDCDLAKACARFGDVDVLPFGSEHNPDPDLLASSDFARVVDELKKQRDFVLVVASPVAAPGGLGVALATDCLLLTATDRFTTQGQLSRDAGQALGLGVPVLGVITVDHGRRPKPHDRRRHVPSRAAGGAGHSDAASGVSRQFTTRTTGP